MARRNELELVIKADADRAKSALSGFTRDLSSSLDGVKSRLFSVNTALAGLAGGAGLGLLAKSAVGTAAGFERLRISLDTVTKGQGEEWFKRMNAWAMKMPINTEEAIQAFIRLRAQGLEWNETQMTIMADTAAALGKGTEGFNTIANAFGKMNAGGKVTAETLNLLTDNGIPALTILKDKLGLSAKEMENIGSAGLKSDVAIKAILQGWQEQFGGMSAKMNGTWDGMVENLKSTWGEFVRVAMADSGAFEELKKQLAGITEEFQNWAAANQDIIKQDLPKYVKGLFDTAKGMVSFVSSNSAMLEGGVLGYLFFGKAGIFVGLLAKAADALAMVAAGAQTAVDHNQIKIDEIDEQMANLRKTIKLGVGVGPEYWGGVSPAVLAQVKKDYAALQQQREILTRSNVALSGSNKALAASSKEVTAAIAAPAARGDFSNARTGDPEKAGKEAEKSRKKAAKERQKAADEFAQSQADFEKQRSDLAEEAGNAWEEAFYRGAEEAAKAREDAFKVLVGGAEGRAKLLDEAKAVASEVNSAYGAMYADTEALAAHRYAFELSALEEQRKAFVDLTGDELTAQAWFNQKSKALWRDWAYTSGGFVDGVKAAFDELTDEQVKWGQVGYDVVRDFAENSKEAVSNLLFDGITGELKDFADYWEATWKSMLRTFTDVLADMAVKWATSKLFGSAGGGSLSVGGVASSAGGSLVSGLANSVLGKGVSAVAGWLGIGGGGTAGIGLASTASTLGTLGVGTPALDALAAGVTAETAGAAGAMTALGVLGTAAGIGAAVFAVGKIMDQVLGSDPTKPWSFDVYSAGAAGLATPLAIGGNSTVTPDVPMTPENYAYYSSPAGMKTWRKAMLAKNRQVNDAVRAAGVETAVNITVNGVVTTDDVSTWAADLAAKNNVFGLTNYATTKTVKAGLQ